MRPGLQGAGARRPPACAGLRERARSGGGARAARLPEDGSPAAGVLGYQEFRGRSARRPGPPLPGPVWEMGGGEPRRKAPNVGPSHPVSAPLPSGSLLRVLSSFVLIYLLSTFLSFSGPHLLPPFLFPSIHLPLDLSPRFLAPPRTFSEVGREGRSGKVPVGVGRPLAAHLSQPGLRPGREPATRHPPAPTPYPARSGVQVLG